ncbi:Snf7-domain-containing protein [Catenaria anguillulae PL171]|uniref:Snf7-domain-containing protein n=1 Tax=Catenaria anguillulae PL171 TaxID=765915 RepID=A0A1Y2HDG9_9FUNG|nr:Snf7-domain-containing protein [Catenaria anguillulae PL171]
MMDFLFGQRKTPAEMLRQHQRALQRAIRDLDREKAKLEQQEKKLIADIKKSARSGQMGATRVMAKDLVRTRRYVQKFYQMRTQLQAVGLRIQTMQSNQAMAEAMKGVTKAMRSMNRQVNLPQITKIMMEFEKEAEMMDMKEELMNDAIDDVMEDAEDEEQEEEIVMKVLDEIGIDLDQRLADTPNISLEASSKKVPSGRVALAEGAGGGVAASTAASSGGGTAAMDDDAALQARLEQLRRSDK